MSPQVRRGLRETEVRFLTDDLDIERNELAIFAGGNGDWYVGVVAEGEVGIPSDRGRFVRVRTSGVAVPGMPVLIARLHALLTEHLPEGPR